MIGQGTRCLGMLLAAVLVMAAPAAIPPESGRPLIRGYGPKDYGADSQNWSLVQDQRGLLYAANNSGVLEFDGARWRLIRTRNSAPVRSLGRNRAGCVFVGAQNEIGYLATDAFGRTQYVGLEDRLPAGDREFGNVWAVTTTSRGTFFLTEAWLFHWDGERLRRWKAPTSFFLSYEVQDRLLVLDKGKGLLELVGDSLRSVPGGERFAGLKPRFMVPAEGHGSPGILWASRAEGLVRFDGQGFHPLRTCVDRYLKDNILYAGIRRADGTLAMSTIQGGIVLMDLHRNRARIVDSCIC